MTFKNCNKNSSNKENLRIFIEIKTIHLTMRKIRVNGYPKCPGVLLECPQDALDMCAAALSITLFSILIKIQHSIMTKILSDVKKIMICSECLTLLSD